MGTPVVKQFLCGCYLRWIGARVRFTPGPVCQGTCREE